MDLSSLTTNPEAITLNEQTNYRLIEIGKIKYYFDQEIKDQELLIKKLSKYITGFDYKDKILFLVEQIYLHMLKQKKNDY